MNSIIVKNNLGKRFKLYAMGRPSNLGGKARQSLQALRFDDSLIARKFILSLDLSQSDMQKIVSERSTLKRESKPGELERLLGELLVSNKVAIYSLPSTSFQGTATLKKIKGRSVQILPIEELMLDPKGEPKSFSGMGEAIKFVDELDPDISELNNIASQFQIPESKDYTKQINAIAEKLAQGQAVVLINQKENGTQLKQEELVAASGIKTHTLGPETNESQIDVMAKIDAEYKVVLFDKQLSKHQDQSEEKVQTDATAVELWLEQNSSSPVFDQGAKVDLSGAGKIQAFLDKGLTTELNLGEVIPADKITGGKKLKIWVTGKTAGKFKIKLTPSKSANGKFIIQPPAELEMGVAELKLEVYEQDSPGIANIQVDPDQDPISKYHTDLESTDLPDQVLLSDENKVKNGRILHAQDNGNFGRSKIVIKALTEDEFPAGCDSYQITVNSGGKSGSLKLFDTEFDGSEIALPLRINKTSLTTDKTYWAEGVSESDALRETRLDLGMDLGGKAPKRNGDWASFTVVKISEINLEVVTTTGKAEVWDKSKKRFYVNLDGTEDARKLTDKPGQRDVKVIASLTKKIPGVTVHFALVPDKRNWDKTHWGANVPNFKFSEVERALKQVDKKDHKDLVHLFAKTNTDGNAEVQSLVLSRIGGDIFQLGAYVDQDAHLSKYIDGHTTLSKRKPVFSSDSIEIWRKFYIQNTFNKNITLPGRALTNTSFEKCFIETHEVDEVKYDPASIGGLVEHERWQFDMSGSTNKVVCVGDINKAKFTSLFKAPTDITKPKAHMVMCDVQWDSNIGNAQTFAFSGRASSINYKNSAGNSYLGVFDPPLGGGAIVQASSKWAWNDGSKTHQGNLNDTNVAIEKSRGHYSEVKIEIPMVCPAGCPCGSPGTAIAPTAVNQAAVRVKLKGATGPWAGESGSPGNPQCLIVVNSNLNQFNNTIAHEIGHLFKSVRKDTNWKGMPDHPHQYVRRGGSGSHCKESAIEHATAVDQNGDKQYVGGTCVMYHVAVGNTVFCDNCSADIRVRDVSDIFKD